MISMERERQNRHIGALMKRFVDRTVAFYQKLPEQPVCPSPEEAVLRSLEERPIPEQGRAVDEVYEEMLREVYSNMTRTQHPRCFACVPSTASMLSWMGDVMTNAYNPHASSQANAAAAAVIEKRLIAWMCSLAGYPQSSGGLFVSGGSMANLTALTAARDAKLSWEERWNGTIYLTDQTHASVVKGLYIIGFREEQIRRIPVDQEFRMDVGALRHAVRRDAAEGRRPFAVIASAGTTNTGSVDPLAEIGMVCRQFDMWMHVDGAYGASALVSPRHRRELAGIELSDSLSWDAHKWLMQTYGCSVVLVRDRMQLVHSFAAHPEYLADVEASPESVEFWDLGPELTRPARALKLWLTVQALGIQGMSRVIDHGCEMAQLTQKLIGSQPGWEIVSSAKLGIVNFRYAPKGVAVEMLDRLNQEISREVTASGYAQILTTQLRGKRVLRMCTIHPDTTEQDIRHTVEFLMGCRAVRDVDRRLA